MTREELREHCEKEVRMCEMWTHSQNKEPSGEVYEEHKLILELLEQEPRWIPVTEDTPPKGTICLWCNKHGSVFISEITYCSEYTSRVGKHGYFCNGPENYGDIVAWMPLPKVYREVEE